MIKFIHCAVVALALTPSIGVTQSFYDFLAGDYREAAAQGDAEAQYDLGRLYFEGKGVPQDDAEAARWYRMAAEQGHAKAQNKLGVMFYDGQGVSRSLAEASRLYRMAAKQGHAEAEYHLAHMYLFGLGVPQDYATAHMWFNIAAANGHSDARSIRDSIENDHMTAAVLFDTQRRARMCMDSGYHECD